MPYVDKIIDYTIFESKSIVDLRTIVVNSIKKGWQPSGGVQTTFDTDTGHEKFYQSMIKYEK